jgi:L-threonylcarbamoyladenylate synthase
MNNSPVFSQCTVSAIHQAAEALKAGYLVAFPTETVYGLGGDATNPDAIKRIYEVKGRPSDHPLIIHISSINMLEKWARDIPEYAISLARKFWPGPLTLILKRSSLVGDFVSGNQDTVGLRVPSDPIAQALIAEFERLSGSAIAATSANRFGQVSPTSSADVQDEIGTHLSEFDLILDGGASTIGIESTIVDCTGDTPRILRSGFVTKKNIEDVLSIEVSEDTNFSEIKFSGSFEKHYAPKCRVILGAIKVEGSGFLALSHIPTPSSMERLAAPTTVEEFARVLYSTLRVADQKGFTDLVVVQPEGEDLALAINDRLLKASRGR